MPTSSQAKILINYETEKIGHAGATRSTSKFSMRNHAQLTVASVYNINGLYSIPAGQVTDKDAINILGRASAQLFKYSKLPTGFKSILSYDPLTKTIRWRILGGEDDIHAEEEKAVVELSRDRQDLDGTGIHRPFTAGSRESSRHVIDRDLFEQLVNLGFRGRGFDISERSSSTAPKSATSIKHLRKYSLKKALSEPRKMTPEVTPLLTERKQPEHSRQSPTESESDEDSSSVDENLDPDGYYRVLPSIYMRKDMPLPRPRSAIFSLRENEDTTHLEVLQMIHAQTDLKLSGLKFDPLNLRASRPDLRSRWIADFGSRDDLESFVRKGLIIGRDRIIIYKYDDVAKREFSTFKYFRSIQDAKKSLKGTKSQKSQPTVEKRKKTVKLREAKSHKTH